MAAYKKTKNKGILRADEEKYSRSEDKHKKKYEWEYLLKVVSIADST